METMDIALLCTIFGAFVAISNWLNNSKDTSKEDGEWRGKVDAKLDLICGIQKDVIRNTQDTQHLKESVARIEEHCENIDNRLDKLEGNHDVRGN